MNTVYCTQSMTVKHKYAIFSVEIRFFHLQNIWFLPNLIFYPLILCTEIWMC
jgi:hypothetical protein